MIWLIFLQFWLLLFFNWVKETWVFFRLREYRINKWYNSFVFNLCLLRFFFELRKDINFNLLIFLFGNRLCNFECELSVLHNFIFSTIFFAGTFWMRIFWDSNAFVLHFGWLDNFGFVEVTGFKSIDILRTIYCKRIVMETFCLTLNLRKRNRLLTVSVLWQISWSESNIVKLLCHSF